MHAFSAIACPIRVLSETARRSSLSYLHRPQRHANSLRIRMDDEWTTYEASHAQARMKTRYLCRIQWHAYPLCFGMDDERCFEQMIHGLRHVDVQARVAHVEHDSCDYFLPSHASCVRARVSWERILLTKTVGSTCRS